MATKTAKGIVFTMVYDGTSWTYSQVGVTGSTDDADLLKRKPFSYAVVTSKTLAVIQTELIADYKTADGIP